MRLSGSNECGIEHVDDGDIVIAGHMQAFIDKPPVVALNVARRGGVKERVRHVKRAVEPEQDKIVVFGAPGLAVFGWLLLFFGPGGPHHHMISIAQAAPDGVDPQSPPADTIGNAEFMPAINDTVCRPPVAQIVGNPVSHRRAVIGPVHPDARPDQPQLLKNLAPVGQKPSVILAHGLPPFFKCQLIKCHWAGLACGA